MPPLARNLVLTAMVALIAGFAGAQLSNRFMVRPADEPASNLRPSVFSIVQQDMTLTPEQKAQIASIEDKYLEQRARTRSRITAANTELAKAMAVDMEFGPMTEAATEKIRSAFGDLQIDSVMYALNVRAVLNPDQQRVFDRKIANILTGETAP